MTWIKVYIHGRYVARLEYETLWKFEQLDEDSNMYILSSKGGDPYLLISKLEEFNIPCHGECGHSHSEFANTECFAFDGKYTYYCYTTIEGDFLSKVHVVGDQTILLEDYSVQDYLKAVNRVEKLWKISAAEEFMRHPIQDRWTVTAEDIARKRQTKQVSN